MPNDPAQQRELTQKLVTAVTGKFALLKEGRHWERGVEPDTEKLITKLYRDVDSFVAHQIRLVFPKHVDSSGNALPAEQVVPLGPFTLAVLKHVASDAVKAVDITPLAPLQVSRGAGGVDWIVSFGAQTGFLHRLVSYFNPEARFDDFVHEGAHHLLGSLAFDPQRCPVWLRHLTIEPPKSKWGIGESLRKNHAALYEEVLANYISYSGDAERAVKKTISTYPHQWHNQFVSRFDVAKSLPAERVIIALQKLTEMYPGFTWLQLENLNDSTEAIVKILKEL